jgi:hypothetical protein
VTGDRLIALCFDGTVDILDARSGRDGRIIASHKVGGVPGAVIYGITRELALVPFARVGLPSVIVWSGEFNNRVIDAIPTTSGLGQGRSIQGLVRSTRQPRNVVLPVPRGSLLRSRRKTFEILVLDRWICTRA